MAKQLQLIGRGLNLQTGKHEAGKVFSGNTGIFHFPSECTTLDTERELGLLIHFCLASRLLNMAGGTGSMAYRHAACVTFHEKKCLRCTQ
jgi:hypothetical protein